MDGDLLALTNTIYGEAAGASFDVKKMVGSSVINRLMSGKHQEFGASIPEIAQKGYYAVSQQNEPYKQAVQQKFPDKVSELAYKQSLAIASGLMKGTIKPDDAMFYFTKKEIAKQKKVGFKFERTRETGSVDKYTTFSY